MSRLLLGAGVDEFDAPSAAKPRGVAGLVHTLWGEGRVCALTVPPRMLALWELSMVPTIAFASSVVWQAAHGCMLWAVAPDGFAFDDAASVRAWYSVIITVVFQGLQFFVGATTLVKMLRRLRSASLLDVFAEYMLLVTTFFGLSFALYICFDEQFLTAYESHSFVNNATVSELTSVPEQLVLFLYYSTSTQTFTGFGDISPLSLTAEAFASLQMCCGIIFSVFIISMTLSRFALTAETASIEAQSEDASEDDFDAAGGGGSERSGSSAAGTTPGRKKSLLHCITRIKILRRIRRLVRGMLLVVIIALEAINLLVLYFVTREEDGSNCNLESRRGDVAVVAALVISLLLQLAVVAMIVMVSLKFVRNTSQVTIAFIVQSYTSTLIAFGALYLTVSLLECGSFSFLKKPDLNFITVAIRFFYFSLVTMTTTGYGMVYPRWWVAQIIVTVRPARDTVVANA
jgi:hypothetical protein